MATSGPTLVDKAPLTIKWEEIGNTNGTAFESPSWVKNVTVQHFGTYGGTLALQGSSDGGTTWTNLTKRDGNAATATGTGWMHIDGCPRAIRPSGGAGVTDVDVFITFR